MKKMIMGLVVLMMFTAPAFAQWAVIDVANLQNGIREYMQLVQQLNQMKQTYDLYMQQYTFLRQQAQMMQNMARYQALQVANWKQYGAPNTYGNTGGFISGLNTGNVNAVTAGYNKLVSPLQQYGGLNSSSQDTVSDAKNRYGLLELSDGINQQSLKTISDISYKSQQNAQALTNLERDSLSSNPNVNTQIQVLNKINAALILQIHQQQDSNQLMASLLAQMTQQNMMHREQNAQDQNAANNARRQMQQNLPTTPEQEVKALRLP